MMDSALLGCYFDLKQLDLLFLLLIIIHEDDVLLMLLSLVLLSKHFLDILLELEHLAHWLLYLLVLVLQQVCLIFENALLLCQTVFQLLVLLNQLVELNVQLLKNSLVLQDHIVLFILNHSVELSLIHFTHFIEHSSHHAALGLMLLLLVLLLLFNPLQEKLLIYPLLTIAVVLVAVSKTEDVGVVLA